MIVNIDLFINQCQSQPPMYLNTYDAFKKILATDGVRGLYRGFIIASLGMLPNQVGPKKSYNIREIGSHLGKMFMIQFFFFKKKIKIQLLYLTTLEFVRARLKTNSNSNSKIETVNMQVRPTRKEIISDLKRKQIFLFF